MIPAMNPARLRRRLPLAALVGASMLVAGCATEAADDVALTPAQAGRELAQRECARCHSITELGGARGGAMSEPQIGAPPPLRDVLDRYSPNRLRMAFQEGMIVGHMEMPVYRLSDEETDALLAYLQSIKD